MAKPFHNILPSVHQRELLWKKIDAKLHFAPSGCHEWQGAKTPKGYGVVGIGPKAYRSTCYVHRLSVWRATGIDPASSLVLHSCDNPACCNPEHLSIGSAKDNSCDMVSKQRQCRGEDIPQAKLKESDVPVIRADTRSLSQIASDYGVDPKQIHRIKQKRAWRHV